MDDEHKQIRLYYHGLTPEERVQHTRVAIATDGVHFTATQEPVGRGSAYWRIFRYQNWWYALAMPGKLLRSRDGVSTFEPGPQLFPTSPTQVHSAVLLKGDLLTVFYTRAGDMPERLARAKASWMELTLGRNSRRAVSWLEVYQGDRWAVRLDLCITIYLAPSCAMERNGTKQTTGDKRLMCSHAISFHGSVVGQKVSFRNTKPACAYVCRRNSFHGTLSCGMKWNAIWLLRQAVRMKQ